MARTPETLREQIARDEGGYRRYVYEDSKGYWTIGFGRCVDHRKGKGISLRIAELMLDEDIEEFTAGVLAALPWTVRLDEPRREVFINMALNMGVGAADPPSGLLGFRKMLTAAERGDWQEAARQLLDSDYHRDVGMRAERLSQQLLTGERQ